MLPDDKVRLAHVALAQAMMAEQSQHSSPYTHPIDTSIPPSADRSTPRAQTRLDYEEDSKRRSRVSVSLAGTIFVVPQNKALHAF